MASWPAPEKCRSSTTRAASGSSAASRVKASSRARRRSSGSRGHVGECDPLPPAAVLPTNPAAGGLDEDAAHGLGRGGEEVPAAVELLVAHQPQIGFVD